MKLAFGYCRVSGIGQAAEDKDGIPRQKEAILKYAATNGFTIKQWFIDTITGKVEDRPALDAMIEALESNGVRTVIIERLERLARKLTAQEAIIARLQRDKYVLISAAEPNLVPEDDDDMESAMRVAMRQMLGIFAELDRKSIKYKLRAGRDKRRAKYGRCEGRKEYGTHPDYPREKETVARILALRAEGVTLAGIAAQLNAEGVTTRSGGKWFEQQVVRIINRANAGVSANQIS